MVTNVVYVDGWGFHFRSQLILVSFGTKILFWYDYLSLFVCPLYFRVWYLPYLIWIFLPSQIAFEVMIKVEGAVDKGREK